MYLGGKGPGAAHGANIGGDHGELVVIKAILGEFGEIVIDKGGIAQQMIHGNVEEALNLGGVEIHGQHPVGAGGGEHIGHQLGGDGIPALGLPILAGIAKIGDYRGNPPGGGPAAGVDHDEQLHQIVVDGVAGGLDQAHVGTANGFLQRNGNLSVGKGFDVALAHFDAKLPADSLCESRVGVTAENLNVISVRYHPKIPRFISFSVLIPISGECIPIIASGGGKMQPSPAGNSAQKMEQKSTRF